MTPRPVRFPWAKDCEPEYMLSWSPRPWWMNAVFGAGTWSLRTSEECAEGARGRPEWQHAAPELVSPLLLARWAEMLLGFPVELYPDYDHVRGLFGRWHPVLVYWAREI